MSEEEIIKILENTIKTSLAGQWDYPVIEKAIKGLLDLYKTQKEELEYYKQKEKDEFEERDRWE